LNFTFKLNKKIFWIFYVCFFILIFHLSMEIFNSGIQTLLDKKQLEVLIFVFLMCLFFILDIRYKFDKRGLYSEMKFTFLGMEILLKSKTIKWCNVKRIWSLFPYWFPSSLQVIILDVSFSDSLPLSSITNYEEILLYIKENINIQMDDNVLKVTEKYTLKKQKKELLR
jgi:hypothetical protein